MRHKNQRQRLQRGNAKTWPLEIVEGKLHVIQGTMDNVTRSKGWRDCRLLNPRPKTQAHVRRLSTIDVVINVCGTMVDVPVYVLVSVNIVV
jgi:hypothetical protein